MRHSSRIAHAHKEIISKGKLVDHHFPLGTQSLAQSDFNITEHEIVNETNIEKSM